MKSEAERAKEDQRVFLIGRIVFPVLMLMCLHDLWKIGNVLKAVSVLQSRSGWIEIVLPVVMLWIYLLIGGVIVWKEASRRKMAESIAGWLLLLLGFAGQQAFGIIFRFASASK